jgi:hypothetical protein
VQLGEVSPDDISDDMVKAVAETLDGSNIVAVSSTGFQVGCGVLTCCGGSLPPVGGGGRGAVIVGWVGGGPECC